MQEFVLVQTHTASIRLTSREGRGKEDGEWENDLVGTKPRRESRHFLPL